MSLRSNAAIRFASLLGVATLQTACHSLVQEPGDSAAPKDVSNLSRTSVVSARQIGRPRVAIEVHATGSLRPGGVVTLTTNIHALSPSARVVLDVSVPELRSEQMSSPDGATQVIPTWVGTLGPGDVQALSGEVRFPAPGYYRAIAEVRASTPPGSLRRIADTVITEEATASVWLLVDERGGRIDLRYDSTAVAGRYPEFGSYGPFLGRNGHRPTRPSRTAALSSAWVDGYMRYYNNFEGTSGYAGVGGGRIDATCEGKSDIAITYDLFAPATAYVGSNGYFLIQCPDGYEHVEAVYSMDGSYSYGRGPHGANPGFNFGAYVSESLVLCVTNDAAARAFTIIEYYAPGALAKLSVTRPKIPLWVSDTDNNYGGHYIAIGGDSVDVITFNRSRLYGEDGWFTMLHEYGHALLWVAIEPPYSSGCPQQGHPIDHETSLQCAFEEGFADFVGAWTVGDKLTNSSTAPVTDYQLEDDGFRSVGDGSIVEGAVAAFFYDLVDDSTDTHSSNNQSSTDDDHIHFPGSYVRDVLKLCSVTTNNNFLFFRLNGIDQFIYCAENSLAAQSLTNSQTSTGYFATRSSTFSSYSETVTEPTGWSSSNIRQLWLYDLFGQGSLP